MKNDDNISHLLSLVYKVYNTSRRYERFNLIGCKEQKGFFEFLKMKRIMIILD